MAVLGGRSRFSRAQKGSGSRTVYRRHRREEILIRPTVLDNAYRNSSSRVSFQRSRRPRRCFLPSSLSFSHSLYLPPLRLPLSTFASPLFFPLPDPAFVPLVAVLFPSAVFIGQRRHGARLHYTHIHSTVAPLEKSGIEPPRPRGRTVPLPPPPPPAASTTSRLAPVPRGYLFPSPSPSSYSLLPQPPSFRPFSKPFCYEAASLSFFPVVEEEGSRDEETRGARGARFSIFSVRRPTGLKDGTEVAGLSTDTHRERESLESVHRSREMEFIAASYTLFSLSLFFFFFLLLSFRQYYLFLFRSFDFPFLFLCLCLCDVTDRNRRGTRRDGKGLAASRACDRSIRIR